MKKLLSITLIVALVAAFAVGCAPKAEPAAAPTPAPTTEQAAPAPTTTEQAAPAPAQGAFKDGTYTAKGTADERGWTPDITITVSGGKITDVKYDELSGDKKKSTDAEYSGAFKQAKNIDIAAVYDTLQKSLVEKQDAATVDTFSGATSASNSFKELAAKALEQAK
jgi:major membrane immunogen (membrane-anchored lipoprotein)